jgi:hypothetical protein
MRKRTWLLVTFAFALLGAGGIIRDGRDAYDWCFVAMAGLEKDRQTGLIECML